ncbi:alkylation response protein AidB-like acyl-CoA dehydrogenase [Novosphingobium kunmingense]|uniref:Alkylation response protein AidB-like acyl-CoA dehydrogenase n=1 Tax=Novosphingobium kunmingense TaxID=1211806 RepID=A0A2N0HK39_9SPHN|nr:acyl-CoA dehydrogenase family protein [Novosphingobium kunmingense]PKB19248.1 alkylation response protein AidB-like acyl-CoA dehydrogenase [Novosphingobium kunmingense]
MLLDMSDRFKPADWTAAARAVAEAAAAHAERHDADDSFVAEGFAQLKQAGLFKALVPVDLGGGGATIAEMCDVIRTIAKGCGSTALAFSMHCHLIAAAAWRREHQNAPTEALLRRVAAEDLILVSSGGNDWLDSGGTAVKVEGGFEITARKPFASGSPAGDLLMTSAVYDDPEEGRVVLHFGVPLKAPGVGSVATWQVLGMRGTGSNDLVLDKVFVADAAISGRRPAGEWHMLFHVISKIAFAMIYAAYVGLAEAARDKAVALAARRSPDPLLAQIAGELDNELLSARLAHERQVTIAMDWAPGPETTSAALACRTLAGRHAIAAVSKALDLAGGQGFYRKAGLERMLRDVQAARFHPLTEKAQQDLAGRTALGWPLA